MSLTEDLRVGTPKAYAALYDEHAGPLHTYCHVMVGDVAADAVRDVFVAVAGHPEAVPLDEDVLPVWLHALARAECARHGAFVRKPAATPMSDPMWRALAGLEAEDRDALALSIFLVPAEIAWILNVGPDTAVDLVRDARRKLEHALSAGGDVVPTALDEDSLRRLMRPMFGLAEDQSERVLVACAAVERTPDGTLIFDVDGMPVVPDPPSETADEPDPAFPETSPDPDAADPENSDETSAFRDEQRRKFRGRRIEGLLQVGSLAALVLLAVGVMAVRSDHSSSGDGGTSRTHERKHTARPPVQVAPPPRIRPSTRPVARPSTEPPTAPEIRFPLDGSTGVDPSTLPSVPNPPFPPNLPVHHSKTPTPAPSPTPTGKDSGSPTPTPSHR